MKGVFPKPLKNTNNQFNIAVTFLAEYNGIFIVTNPNNKIYFAKSIIDKDGFFQISTPPGAYEITSLNNEIKRFENEEGRFTETNYLFTNTPNFSTFGSILEISRQKFEISFTPDDSIQDLLGFIAGTIYEEYNLSPKPIAIFSFDNFFLECDNAQGIIFKGKTSGIFHNFMMDVDSAYTYIEKFGGGLQGNRLESKDFFSSINFENLKKWTKHYFPIIKKKFKPF